MGDAFSRERVQLAHSFCFHSLIPLAAVVSPPQRRTSLVVPLRSPSRVAHFSLFRSRAHVGTLPRPSLRRLPMLCVVLGLFGCGEKGSTLTLLTRQTTTHVDAAELASCITTRTTNIRVVPSCSRSSRERGLKVCGNQIEVMETQLSPNLYM
jgi:hypothetical protein